MDQNSGLIQFEPATSLENVYNTTSTVPLLTPHELQAFYRGGINKVRRGDKVGSLARGLERSWQSGFFRWFGVHPLVVDILARQGRLERAEGGKVPGGTE